MRSLLSLSSTALLLSSTASWINPSCAAFSSTLSLQHRTFAPWQQRATLNQKHQPFRHLVIVSSSQRPSPQQQYNKENLSTLSTTTTSPSPSSATSESFWNRQKELAEEMSQAVHRSIKSEQKNKFAKRRMALVADTGYFMALIFATLWLCSENPFVAISYVVGATCGLAYSYGLGKYVETLGGSADDDQEVQGAGVGAARFAFLILLFVLVGKLKGYGFVEIPAIMGFFTYQLATLSQGLREIND